MFAFLCLLVISGTFFISSDASKCEKLSSLAALEDHNTIVDTSLRLLVGTWISESCETRPGPEYVLRWYNFDEEGKYHLIQHYYWDDSCSSPKLTVSSFGRITLRNSLIQPGAVSGNLKTINITIIPQDNDAAKELDRTVASECPGHYWKSWRRYEEHTVYQNRNEDKRKTFNLWTYQEMNNHHSVNNPEQKYSDISCLRSLKSAFNELKLLKIQLRPLLENLRKRPKQMKMELLLGDIHTKYKMREYYSPTSFQIPLVKQTKGETVVVNKHTYVIKTVNNIPTNVFATGKTPPHLLEKPHLPPYIWGEWASSRCEARPMGLYLTRRFSFYSEDSTWIGEHKFYSDPFCKNPKFIVTAAGRFVLAGPSKELKGTTNIDFDIERASLTVLDERMIYEMHLPGLCGLDQWEVNVPKELSSTNGCMQLGIILPSIQLDIVKLEMNYKGACLLFMGQVDTDSLQSTTTERPTAFQLPLVKCGEVATYSQGLRDILYDNVYTSESHQTVSGYLNIVLSLVLFFLIR